GLGGGLPREGAEGGHGRRSERGREGGPARGLSRGPADLTRCLPGVCFEPLVADQRPPIRRAHAEGRNRRVSRADRGAGGHGARLTRNKPPLSPRRSARQKRQMMSEWRTELDKDPDPK